jgi:hypothetical protein
MSSDLADSVLILCCNRIFAKRIRFRNAAVGHKNTMDWKMWQVNWTIFLFIFDTSLTRIVYYCDLMRAAHVPRITMELINLSAGDGFG